MDKRLMNALACPACRSELSFTGESNSRRMISGELGCVGCGLVFSLEDEIPLLVPPGTDYSGAIWDGMEADSARLVPEWVRSNFNSKLGTTLPPIAQEFVDEVRAVEGPVLDIASGPGGSFCPEVIADVNTDRLLVMSDLGVPVMRAWRQQLLHVGWADRCSLMVLDARRLPFMDGSISAVTSVSGMQNVCGDRQAYEEAARVLCPGGRLLDIAMFWVEGGPTQTRIRELGNATTTCIEYRALCRDLGLVVERWEPFSAGRGGDPGSGVQDDEAWECRMVFAIKDEK